MPPALLARQPDPAPARPGGRTAARRLLIDRGARFVVSGGGLAVIASILAILLFILIEVWPLTRPADVETEHSVAIAVEPLAIASDEYRGLAISLSRDGFLRTLRVADGTQIAEAELPGRAAGQLLAAQAPPGFPALAAATSDGRVLVVPVVWRVSYDAAQKRSVSSGELHAIALEIDPQHRPLGAFAAQAGGDGGAIGAAQRADGTIGIVREFVTRNEMTGETRESADRFDIPLAPPLTALVLDPEGRSLYGGTANGELLWWTIGEAGVAPPQVASAGPSPVTALTLLVGGRSLVVGQGNGALSVWFAVRQEDESQHLTRIHDFPGLPGAIRGLARSPRNKGFVAVDDSGRMGLFYSTSERVLWSGPSPVREVTAVGFAPKADGVLLAGPHALAALRVRNPHPEVSLRALFGKIWYEGYPEPTYTWQSTGGSDDFEPKLSLVPLLVGTLKGTLYSLLLAIPIGVLGAMYASQFMHPRLLRFVKPLVEIMAALPSVVLGFLAGLWLAPAVARSFSGFLLMLPVLPLLVLAVGALWRALPRALLARLPSGGEVLAHLLALALGAWACLGAAPWLDRTLFGGSFQDWLRQATGLPYDQRNAVIVGLAMGVAVIPIIFAIAEDAFSNVPRNLVAGSLALGANRWQTVTKVVLPTASPGIFSAVMIGFGRAVGETMIVLMATGNTPILSFNPFNGFRTLSANIAVEIPEAPAGGTLYRTLFLAALLLFFLTFVVNTLAEMVRQRLRKRYAEL